MHFKSNLTCLHKQISNIIFPSVTWNLYETFHLSVHPTLNINIMRRALSGG